MGKRQELKAASSHIIIEGVTHRWDSFSQAERDELCEKMMANVGEHMTEYYFLHPEHIPNAISASDDYARQCAKEATKQVQGA